MESAPTDRGNPAANRKPCVAAAHVGAHIVRPGNPAANRKPRAAATHVGAHIVRPGNPAADRKPCVAAAHVGAHIVRPGNPAADRKPRVAATHVGDDARIVPGNPAIPQGPREAHDPPLQTPANARPNGMAPRTRATVGRDALIPPHPAAAQTPAGGMNPAPTDRGNPAANRKPRGGANPCRGRFHIGPACVGAGARGRDACRPPQTHTKTLRPADGSRRRGGLCFGPRGVTIIQLDKNCIKQEAFPWGCSKGTQSRRSAG